MADNGERYRIPLFDGTNFSNWSFRIKTLLTELEILEYIQVPYNEKVKFLDEDDESTKKAKKALLQEHAKNDRKCRSQIIQRIDDNHLEYVKDSTTAHELWSSLTQAFQRTSITSQLYFRKKLLQLKFVPQKESLESHFLTFDKLIRELRGTGATVEENDSVCMLLLSMPKEFDSVVTAIETLTADKLTISFVKNRLMDEETKRAGCNKNYVTEPSVAFNVSYNTSKSKKGQKKNSSSGGDSKFRFKCYSCNQVGHKKSECPLKKEGGQQSHQARTANTVVNCSRDSSPEAFMFAAYTGHLETEFWLLDSGATEHLVTEKVRLENVKVLEKPIMIKAAKSDSIMCAKEVGELCVNSCVNEKVIQIKISEVLSVPGLECNLLSVSKLEMKGFRIVFENGKGIISKNDSILAVAERNYKNLYVLNFYAGGTYAHLTESISLWHKRLGHLNYKSIKVLSKQVDNLKFKSEKAQLQVCSTCMEGKQTKLPHKQTRIRAKRALELVHSDVMGPISPISHDNKRYIVSFIDDFTHFTATYLMETKGEAFKFFKIYEAMATAHFGNKISRFRCDNGKEFLSNEMKTYFEERGIQNELTIRYTPEQNGVAERLNRTICERARCLLLSSSLAKTFWSEAVKTSVYLINRSPTSALGGKIPAVLWYGYAPNYLKLKIFGCVAYLRIPKELIDGKFDSRSIKCYMIGYCKNGYLLWCPEERRMYSGKDVVFDESKFKIDDASDSWLFNDISNGNKSVNTDKKIEENDNCDEKNLGKNHEIIQESEILLNKENEKSQLETPRRSSRERKQPNWLKDYATVACLAESYINEVPECFDDIDKSENKNQWYEAVNEEIRALNDNNTWTLCNLPIGKKLIGSKWVFKIKPGSRSESDKFKARLVVKGCAQRKGFDYEETYTPVACLTTLRVLLNIAAQNNFHTRQMDVKNAFLHGELNEDIYMSVPVGVKASSDLVCKLNKTLYGLKQAPREWNGTFDKFMKNNGFKNSEVDQCLYIGKFKNDIVYLLLYVDDMLLISNSLDRLNDLKFLLENNFRMKDLGVLNQFLGIQIKKLENGLFLSQRSYLEKLLSRFNMSDCNIVKTPMETKFEENTEDELLSGEEPYRELVGCLLYVTQTTRPDLSYSVNFFSRFQSQPKQSHWKGLKRILRYIKGTLNLGIYYCKSSSPNSELLIGYADADWGGSIDRKSTSGFVFQLFGNLVSWATKKQLNVALSSTEAEYVALATGASEFLWLKSLLACFDIYIDINNSVIFEDNQSCIHLLHKWEHKRLKHVDIKYNFVKDFVNKKVFKVQYIPTCEQIADMFKKSLPLEKFVTLRKNLGMLELN